MLRLIIGLQIVFVLMFFTDFQVEANPVMAPCSHCIDFLKFRQVSHPFETAHQQIDEFCANVTDFVKCIENCFDPRAPPDFLLANHTGWLFRSIADLKNVTDEICTNRSQLREDFQVESHPMPENCIYCTNYLQLGSVYHPFEHLTRDKPLDYFCIYPINYMAIRVYLRQLEYVETTERRVTNFARCVEYFECFDPRAPPDFLFALRNGWIFRALRNLINVTDEICTNGTRLREDYLTHSQCFRSVYNRTYSSCSSQSTNSYLDYFDPYLRLFDQNDALQMEKLDCATAAVFMGCLGLAIHEECGDDALGTFKEIIDMFGFFKMGLCSTETLQTLRTVFIDSLQIDESKKSFYREIFV